MTANNTKTKIIVIEGLDGSGKATQTELLAQRLSRSGQRVRRLEFPDYASPASAPVRMYLSGEFGDKPWDVNAYTASAFYAVDRAASFLKNWKRFYAEGGVILSDRYATSNIIYQMSKLEKEQWDGFISWIYDFEYEKLQIPAPNLVIYLDVAPEVSQKLLKKRYGGDESKKDLHEKNFSYLLECRESALYAAQKCGWKTVDCCENGEIKPIEAIFEEIVRVINNS